MVSPLAPDVMRFELSWFINWVVFNKRTRVENLFAFLRIWTMSMEGVLGMAGVGAPLGEAGTRGTVLNPGAGAVAGVAGGAVGGEINGA